MPGFTLRRTKAVSPSHSNLINIQDVRIASPCPADWSKMRGDDRVRHCAECNLNVYNFSAMTAPEVESLLAQRQGTRLCARIYRRADGTMLVQDCPRGVRAVVWRVSRAAAAALAAVMSLNSAWGQTDTKPKAQKCEVSGQPERHEAALALDIVDPDGALIPKAQVTLQRKDGRKKRRGVSNDTGQLHMVSLKAADYMLTVSAKGFRQASVPVTLKDGKVLEIQIKMQLAEVAAEVVVVGETPTIAGGATGVVSVIEGQGVPEGMGHGTAPQPMKQ